MEPQPPYQPYAPPASAAQAPGAGVVAEGHYEFTEVENKKISVAASRTTWWGILALVTGAMFFLCVVATGVFWSKLADDGVAGPIIIISMLAPLTIIHLATGLLYITAGTRLRAVVDTQGDDIGHLLNALDRMGKAFSVEVVATGIAFFGAVGVAVLAAVF